MIGEIFVTGASGFIGRALMSQLLNSGFLATGLSRRKVSVVVTVANYSDVLVPDGA